MSLRYSSLAALLALPACGGNSASPIEGTASIGPAGGTVEVTTGDIAGAKVEIPPGALTRSTRISISPLFAPAVPGFVTLGPGVTFGPAGLEFKKPVTITVPFDPARLLTGSASVLAKDELAWMVENAPASMPEPGLVTVDVASFSTNFAAQRFLGGVATEDFLPLQSGNEWLFENGARISATFSFTEPNLTGPTLVFLIENADENLGLYLNSNLGTTELLGEFRNLGSDSFQQLHDATPFLPQAVTINRRVETAFEFTHYDPFGSTDPAYTGLARIRIVPRVSPDVETAVGQFTDVFQFSWITSFRGTGGQEISLPLILTLARDVGPVRLTAFGSSSVLVSGTVDGDPIAGLEE